MGKSRKVAIYTRVSSNDQNTLLLQLEKAKFYAQQRDWQVVFETCEVECGSKTRPERERIMRMARRKEIDVVLVWKLDRWGRSVSDLIGTLKELQELKVGFVSITEALDFTTAAGRAMAGLLSVFAEFERDLLKERVRAGLEQAKRQGKKLGRPRTAMSKSREIRKLYHEKLSKSEIARRLGIDRRSVGRVLAHS